MSPGRAGQRTGSGRRRAGNSAPRPLPERSPSPRRAGALPRSPPPATPPKKLAATPPRSKKTPPEGGHFCTLIDIPVTKRSGRIILVQRQLAANRRLADAACHWAIAAIRHDAASRAICHALRSRGHARALRSVADRFLNVVCKMIETGQTFDPERRSKAAPLNQKKRLTSGCVPPTDCVATSLLFALVRVSPLIDDRIAPIQPKRPLRQARSRGRLEPLVFRCINHVFHALHDASIETRFDDLRHR